MACESRENDPTKQLEFVLKCSECNYWLCNDCREQLVDVGRFNCLNCDTKLIPHIPQIIKFKPIAFQNPRKEINTIEDLMEVTYTGDYASVYRGKKTE